MPSARRPTVKDFYYNRSGEWLPLPEWATFLVAAGAAVGSHDSAGQRLVIGAALPARGFGAALAATEIVVTRCAQSGLACDGGQELGGRFEELCSMSPGTPVILLNPPTNRSSGARDRKLKGVINGCADAHGERRLKITINAGGGSYLIAARDSWRIELSQVARTLPKRQTGQLVAPVKALARHVLGEEPHGANRPSARLDCVILGRASQVAREVVGVDFAVKTARGAYESGVLQDILRARRFIAGDAVFYSDVLRVDGAKPAKPPGGALPHVTVFDGARGFLRWRHLWRDTNWLVLLDRTAPHFDEAASALNTELINRVDDSDVLAHVPVPAGIEIMAFTVARRR